MRRRRRVFRVFDQGGVGTGFGLAIGTKLRIRSLGGANGNGSGDCGVGNVLAARVKHALGSGIG